MGLFGSDDISERVQKIAENAKHNSVTEEKLGKKTASGFGSHDYLNDKPLIDYLEDNEQPHFIWALADSTNRPPVTVEDGQDLRTNSKVRVMIVLTDIHIVFVVGNKDGDKKSVIEYSEIDSVEINTNFFDNKHSHALTLETSDNKYHIRGGIGIDVQDSQVAADIISTMGENVDYTPDTDDSDEPESSGRKRTNQSESGRTPADDTPDQTTPKSTFQETVDGLSNINESDINDIKNDQIPKNIIELDDYINSEETFHYAYAINAAVRGEDTMGGYTTGGCLLATDSRLTAYINETIGSSNLSIDYDKIDTVEIEHGAMATKLSVQSTSKTYTFPGFNSIDKSEIHDFADFIRDQASEAKTQDSSGSSLDPTEQLKNIRELHEQGALTDEEFEEKKQDLLDKL